MVSADTYINIHTHKLPNDESIAILNVLPEQDITQHATGNLFFSCGIHPWYIQPGEHQTNRLLKACNNQKMIAIGECGIDKLSKTSLDKQKTLFRMQIELSEKQDKPLIIHCVRSFHELFHIKKEMKPTKPWIVHGFNNNMAIASQCTQNGIILSFGEALFREGSNACNVIKSIPGSQFFLETDDSDFKIKEVYQQCCMLRNITLQELKQMMFENFNNYFKL